MSSDERRRLAGLSVNWHCSTCGKPNKDMVPPIDEAQEAEGSQSPKKEEQEVQPTPTMQTSEAPAMAPSLPVPSQPPSPPSVAARIRPEAATPVPIRAPAWIDRLIGLLVVLLAVLVIRKSGSFDLGSQAESLTKA